MANQVIVTNTGNVQVALTPPANVQVQISRAAIGTVSNVPTANFANYAANVTASNQPNITTLGTLTALNVSGNGTVNNLTVTGNLSVGNLFANNANYSNFAGEAFNVNASNITGTVANANYAANAGNATIANSANSVTLANVSGAGNIASINLDGNASNILFGNGAFSAIPVVSNVANANYANFSGTAFSVSGSNVSGEVANANYSSYANIAVSANSVAVGNVSGIGNIAVINLDGNASNVLFGNGTFGPESGNLNANYANFAGEAFNVNASNITGTVANANYSAYAGEANTANLATFATTANAVAGANVSGTVANATFALDAGNANLANLATYATTANSVVGANVSGEVANANYSSYSNIANIANSVALANVVGIGNIANINLDGSSSNVLFGNGVFAPESTSIANANYANFAGTLINGNSNVTIAANSSILISAAGNANIVTVDGNGSIFSNPLAGGYNNWLRLNNYGTTANGQNASRISSFRYRGSSGANLSVQANDGLMDFLAIGYNGTSLATNSSGRIKAVVDNSYTANVANIPVGWQVQVNDTNGGINNQPKTHNFYSNGNVTFANAIFGNSLSVTGNISGDNISATGNISGNNGSFAGTLQSRNTFSMFLDNNTTQGLFQQVHNNANIQTAQWTSWRFRGNVSNPLPALAGDEVSKFNSVIYGDSGNTYKEVFQQVTSVTENDGAGNTAGAYKVIGFGANSTTQFYAKEHQFGNIALNTNATIYGNGSANFANLVTSNFFSGDGGLLSNITGANITGTVANATFALDAGNSNLANTANSVALANVVGIGNIANINLDGSSSNVLFGNGIFAPESTSIANANYANFAGDVVNSSQPNITSVGNLPYLQVSNSANADGVINQFASNNITIATNFSNVGTYKITTIFHPNASTGYPGEKFVRSRGNVTNPTTVVMNDRLHQRALYAYNGNTNVLSGVETFTAVGTINSNANAAHTGGQWSIATGNPSGDIGNATATSPQNVLTFNNSGTLLITPGAVPNTSLGQSTSQAVFTSYGQSTTNLVSVGGLNFQRARGNRDSLTTVAAGDTIGRSVFIAYSNGAYQSSNVATYRVEIDSTYVANDVVVPMSHRFGTVANVANVATFRTFNFYSNALAQFPGNVNFSGSTANLFTGSSGQVALGIRSGLTSQSGTAVAIGTDAGANAQSSATVAVGQLAGSVSQGQQAVALGYGAGSNTQSQFSIAIGGVAGEVNQGQDSIAIGRSAGRENQANNSIILNATGSNLNQTTANTFTVKPVRNLVQSNAVFYNSSSGEITYDTLANNTSNVSAANVTINSNGFMKLASYTEAALTAITGQIGWMAAVTNSASFGNPNGMIAFWDTTNNRWSYIHDNSAV